MSLPVRLLPKFDPTLSSRKVLQALSLQVAGWMENDLVVENEVLASI
jgi:hypothetical protein